MAWRYLAQHALDLHWLHTDLPIAVDGIGRGLNGAGQFTGTISPELATAMGDDGRPLLQEWATFLYAETDGYIRGGYILTRSEQQGPTWRVTGTEFSGYPNGIPDLQGHSWSKTDPLDVVRQLWAYVQDQPDGDLGMVVDATKSGQLVGTDTEETTDAKGKTVTTTVPMEMNWWDAPDIGQTISSLAQETPFDYAETHTWGPGRETVQHRLLLGYPRLGTKRTDLSFSSDTNITAYEPVVRDGDDYGTEALVLGAGEGDKRLKSHQPVRAGTLRRVQTYQAQDITDQGRINALAKGLLTGALVMGEVTSLTVRDHEAARLGSWSPGDDIFVAIDDGYALIRAWHRIVGDSLQPDTGTANLTLARSDRFMYGAGGGQIGGGQA